MTPTEQLKNVKDFVKRWNIDCKEDGNTAPFWLSLLRDVFGVDHPEEYVQFEDTVKHEENGNSLYVDAWIPSARILIEQKATSVALDKPYKRHNKTFKNVYEQAFEYDMTLPYSQRSRYIIACNFHEFWIYDMDMPEAIRRPIKLDLTDMPKHFHQLDFLVDNKSNPTEVEETKVSIKAGQLVGKLYDAFLAEYKKYGEPTDKILHDLNVICVRVVFLLYAEDSGLFAQPDMFCRYLESWRWENSQDALQKLFKVLDTKKENRSPFLDPKLATFPYVNGGLFREDCDIPPITEEIYNIILNDMGKQFDWSGVNGAVLGGCFESTLNPVKRRQNGQHFTTLNTLAKVINPLFLDGLNKELETLLAIPESEKYMANRKELTLRYDYKNKLEAFQDKLANIRILDPAAGCSNFLVASYIGLRRLENKVIQELSCGMQFLDMENPIKVSIKQFYGIEINDFAVSVSKASLWIAEIKMMKETENIIRRNIEFFPLKEIANIHEGNALKINWENVVPKDMLSYICSNPPYIGYSLQTKSQKDDIRAIYVDENGKPYKSAGKIDYVAGWFFKAAQYMKGTHIKTTFVSTNSVCQGEQVAAIWKPLYERFHINIDFAWRSFEWESESIKKAVVYCVIVGFSDYNDHKLHTIFDGDTKKETSNINPYLVSGDTVFIESRRIPICKVPEMVRGSQPTDNGNLILTESEKDELLKSEPKAAAWIRPFMMGKDFIDRKARYCLWLINVDVRQVRKSSQVMKRIEAVRNYRLASKKAATRKKADTPMLFDEKKESSTDYIAVPIVSSSNRKYIPIDWLKQNVIAGNKLFMIRATTKFHFGVLTSNVHMAWMRAVGGRLGIGYSYSNTVVYNNFPWPTPTEAQKARIEKTAQGILDARANHPNDSLADLYDPLLMPADLRKAHVENDRAVMEAYGFNWHTMKEEDCVAELMKMYQKLVDKENAK